MFNTLVFWVFGSFSGFDIFFCHYASLYVKMTRMSWNNSLICCSACSFDDSCQ